MNRDLNKICETIYDVDLTNYNTFKLHSKAYAIVFPSNLSELSGVIKFIKESNYKYFVIGNGSNIILPSYYDGVIIKLSKFDNYEISEDILNVDCGVMINKLAIKLINMGYAGLDFACGIPGSIGGCIYGNAGCYLKSISDSLISVTLFDGENIFDYSNEELKFDYRYSILKEKNDLIILSAKFQLTREDKTKLIDEMNERIKKRILTQDLTHPSNGSVFRNPEGLYAGKLIDDINLKGYSINDAMISNKHANFIINNGNASSEDIIRLINYIKREVKNHYDVELHLEQEIIN